jgi:hypothetical protein
MMKSMRRELRYMAALRRILKKLQPPILAAWLQELGSMARAHYAKY